MKIINTLKHVGITINKANRVLGTIKRTACWHGKSGNTFEIVQVTGKTYSVVRGPSVEPILCKNHSHYTESSKKSVQTRPEAKVAEECPMKIDVNCSAGRRFSYVMTT